MSEDRLDLTERFLRLFEGNTRSSGRFDPKRERMFTEEAALKVSDIAAHFEGTLGAGSVPIHDDDTCFWAAIDIDNHDTDEDIPISEVDELIRTHRLPLVPCRSKSGGIHVYLFLEKPQPAVKIRVVMAKWAGLLGYGSAEIFPKQGKLINGKEGKRQLGNWLNLPYFDIVGQHGTMRYAVKDGKKLTLVEFLDYAEKHRATDKELHADSLAEHPDAPPCIQRILVNGVAQGHRNEAIYNVAVYLRKAFPEQAEQRAKDANLTLFTKPLPRAELTRTINSALRPDCQYRCNEEPVKTLCDRDTCLQRKFGITTADADRMAAHESLPAFTELTKYMTDPVRWEVKIDGVKVTNIMTPQLLEFRAMREIIADRLTKIVPMIKPVEWERMLMPMMQEARIIDVPDEASVAGVMRDRLREFAAKSDLLSKGEDKTERKILLRGLPVVQVMDGERSVCFRAQDFVNYLKRTKSEELKGVNLYFAIKELGMQHTKFRAGDENINIWYLPVSQVLNGLTAEPPAFKSEI
jgi:hypothetical protein